MPDRSSNPPAVQIDRLIFDVPGLDRSRARVIAYAIGQELMSAGLSGNHSSINIALDGDGPDLAVRIAAALREKLL